MHVISVHHRALGDVAGTNRFENLAISVQHDLDVVKLAHRKGGKVPKFQFEQKSFNIVKCNTDLAETELEIEVVRGIGYNVSKPKDVDTYVKVEFPYPQVIFPEWNSIQYRSFAIESNNDVNIYLIVI